MAGSQHPTQLELRVKMPLRPVAQDKQGADHKERRAAHTRDSCGRQVKAVSREKRAADAAKGALEVDLKAVLARHAREVEAAATARREASREKAARAAADAELARLSNQVSRLPACALDAHTLTHVHHRPACHAQLPRTAWCCRSLQGGRPFKRSR